MAESSTDRLRNEFKADIRELKSDFSADLNAAVARIEASLKAHSEASAARQAELVSRIQSHDDRQTASFNAVTDWRILVETRLAQQSQATKISASIFGAVGAGILSFLFRLAACSVTDSPPPVALPPYSEQSKLPGRTPTPK
jgi:hypothetical protein